MIFPEPPDWHGACKFDSMALITGIYKNAAEAQLTSEELVKAGIASNAIRMAPAADSKIELSVSTDGDNAEAALRIMKIHGSVDTSHRPSAGEVSGDRPYVTENRDTSREPLEDRDDVEGITAAIDRKRARMYQGPK